MSKKTGPSQKKESKPIALTPWETLPESLKGKVTIRSKLLTDMEILAVEGRLSRPKAGKVKSRVVTDEMAAELEDRMTRHSIVLDVLGTTESALKSRRYR